MNLRDKILQEQDSQLLPVVIPEWDDVTVYLRTWTGSDRVTVEKMAKDYPGARIHAHLFIFSVCDENGSLLFTKADIAPLNEKSGKVLGRIANLALEHNGIGGEKKKDDEEKNS